MTGYSRVSTKFACFVPSSLEVDITRTPWGPGSSAGFVFSINWHQQRSVSAGQRRQRRQMHCVLCRFSASTLTPLRRCESPAGWRYVLLNAAETKDRAAAQTPATREQRCEKTALKYWLCCRTRRGTVKVRRLVHLHSIKCLSGRRVVKCCSSHLGWLFKPTTGNSLFVTSFLISPRQKKKKKKSKRRHISIIQL